MTAETIAVAIFSPEEVFQVITATSGPGQVAGVPAFDPFSGHYVGVAGAGGMVIIMAHSHTVKEKEMCSHSTMAVLDMVW